MCDTLCALPGAAAAGATVFAKNSDRPPNEPQDIEWHPARHDASSVRTTYIEIDGAGETLGVLGSRPRWMWGFEHGVNEAGVAVGNEAVYTTTDPREVEPALVGMDLVRLALERSSTASEGVATIGELVDRYGQGGAGQEGGKRPYWSSFLLADPREAYVVETSGQEVAVEQVVDRRAISNRLTIPAFDRAHGIGPEVLEVLVDPRLRASQTALAAGPVSVDAMKTHLRSHDGGDEGWTVCMHAGTEATTAAMVVELPEQGPRVAHVLMGQPCRSIFVPLVVGEPLGPVPPWERFAALDAAGADDRQKLEERLAAEVRAGIDWNQTVWALVEQVID